MNDFEKPLIQIAFERILDRLAKLQAKETERALELVRSVAECDIISKESKAKTINALMRILFPEYKDHLRT